MHMVGVLLNGLSNLRPTCLYAKSLIAARPALGKIEQTQHQISLHASLVVEQGEELEPPSLLVMRQENLVSPHKHAAEW